MVAIRKPPCVNNSAIKSKRKNNIAFLRIFFASKKNNSWVSSMIFDRKALLYSMPQALLRNNLSITGIIQKPYITKKAGASARLYNGLK